MNCIHNIKSKFIEKNIDKPVYEIEVGQDYLNNSYKVEIIKKKILYFSYVESEIFYAIEDIKHKAPKEANHTEAIFVIALLNKGILTSIYTEVTEVLQITEII